jgi:hypothetical protein
MLFSLIGGEMSRSIKKMPIKEFRSARSFVRKEISSLEQLVETGVIPGFKVSSPAGDDFSNSAWWSNWLPNPDDIRGIIKVANPSAITQQERWSAQDVIKVRWANLTQGQKKEVFRQWVMLQDPRFNLH